MSFQQKKEVMSLPPDPPRVNNNNYICLKFCLKGLDHLNNTGNSILKIEINTEKPQKMDVRIVDINGKIIARILEGKNISGHYQQDYNTSDLGNGTYLINLSCGLANLTNKIIILK